MDPFDIDSVKTEKANAMLRYRRLQKIANLFRFLEVFLALALLSWFSTRLPIAFSISGKYFRQLFIILISPRFVFIVGNAIIITLFVKSGQFSVENRTGNESGTDFYEEFIKNSENRPRINTEIPQPEQEEIAYVDKQTVYEETTISPTFHGKVTETKIYRRSQSENMKLVIHEKPKRELRRSATEKCRKIESSEDEPVDASFSADDLSSEEFKRTVEAFIAKQQQFQREESMAIVLPNES